MTDYLVGVVVALFYAMAMLGLVAMLGNALFGWLDRNEDA